MEFDEVENLSVEQILELYSDTVEQGNNIIAGPQGYGGYYDPTYDAYYEYHGWGGVYVHPCADPSKGYCTDRYYQYIK